VALVKADETMRGEAAKYQYHADGGEWRLVEDFLLYGDMADIHEAQYAQNFQTMVLAQRNYAPLILELRGGEITVNKFVPEYSVPVEKHDDLIDATPWFELDEAYAGRRYLAMAGEYPGAVTFFNGRLVFAATGNSRQRIFASRVNAIKNFSTYKLFLTRQRNYIVIKGTFDETDKRRITFETGEGLKFSEAITNYHVESGFFPTVDEDGAKVDVRVEELKSNYIRVSCDSELITELSTADQAALDAIKSNWAAYNANPEQQDVIYVLWSGSSKNPGGTSFIRCRLSVTTMVLWAPGHEDVFTPMVFSLPSDIAETADAGYLLEYINDRINIIAGTILPALGAYASQIYWTTAYSLASAWHTRIMSSMKLTIDKGSITLYGPPSDIEIQVNHIVNGWRDTYIALYTEHVIEDRYPSPDDGFTFEIASDMSDAIKWLAQNKSLLAGTETGEWVIPPETNAVNVRAALNSRYGSDSVQATAVGDAVCFFQTGKKALVEYYVPQQDYNFRANNMAMLSKNMLHESPAFDFDFISAPYTKLFVSREDGAMACLLYERGTGTFAWGRVTTRGLVKSVATIPGRSGYDDVYLLVRRGGGFFLEIYSERVRERGEGDEEVFLDSYRRWDGDREDYTDDAVVYDETDNRLYPVTQSPVPDHVMWAGYPYESRVRSMPVLANDRMKQNNIKNLLIRFNDSCMPEARSFSMEEGREREGNTDAIARPEPYSGVIKIPFPGVWDRDVFFELVHRKPTRCRVLAVNAEAN
jgi:hypothetical protein